jgi:hypothetical protein
MHETLGNDSIITASFSSDLLRAYFLSIGASGASYHCDSEQCHVDLFKGLARTRDALGNDVWNALGNDVSII